MTVIRMLLSDTSRLKQSDIGVVSPYKLQCKNISNACEIKNFKEITIGTTEVFQGQEKKVMIVSTVVSRRKHPGRFVINPQVSVNNYQFYNT